MQTGVMAYRRNERVAAFWEETRKVYLEKGGAYWRQRSSGELHSEIYPRFVPL